MSSEGIDMKIMDDIEEEEIMIIYKGRKNQEKEEEEEEIIEVKTKKKEFLKKFRYFKSRNKELEQQEEIFIHDKFCTSTFKAVVESLNTKFVEVGENNYEELLLISNKYEYYELSRTIEQFMKERPDLERILSSLRQEKNKEEEDNEYSDDEEEGEGMRDYEEETEKNKEEMIASHLDFFLERGLLKRMNIKRLLRILNCKSRVIHNHHALFEFIKEIMHDNDNDKNKKNKYKEYYDMLFWNT
ncbi:hypothetical protein M9Y10_031652 [Tritrichomonas musculus]|uniref:BTB domain-containing protein n=1 Tax=Tritrichomonas musculus TaxID=1915356 RepID=A0ABR2H2C4_9EUKA